MVFRRVRIKERIMKNNRKLLILLGFLTVSPFIIPTYGTTMVDPLSADCRIGFITGSLWNGKPVSQEQIALTLGDIGEQKESKTTTSITQGEGSTSPIDIMLDETREVLEAVSVSRGEEDSHRANIRSFFETLKKVSVSAKLGTIERLLSIIFTKYAE